MGTNKNPFFDFLSNVLSDKFNTEYGKINYRFGIALLICGILYLYYQFKISKMYLECLQQEFALLGFFDILKPALCEIFICLFYIGLLTYAERKLKKESSLW